MSRFDRRIFNLVIVAAALVVTTAAAPATAARGPKPKPGATSEGIDVSHWQGAIDWTKVKASDKSFAFIKATEGTTFVDPRYSANYVGARTAGVVVSGYDFAQPSATPGAGAAEADWFVAHTTWAANDLRPALDLEVTGGLGITALQQWVGDWLNEVYRLTGRHSIIYTSRSFWINNMGDTDEFALAGVALWLAKWNVKDPSSYVPANNWGGAGWSFWQYSDCGTVNGIGGCVDLDRAYGTDLTLWLFG